MGIGPVPATQKLMERLGLKISDFDLIELNEAFASQGIAVLRQLGVKEDADFVNPHGGAIALGHPLGMSGARLALTAVHGMKMLGGNARRAVFHSDAHREVREELFDPGPIPDDSQAARLVMDDCEVQSRVPKVAPKSGSDCFHDLDGVGRRKVTRRRSKVRHRKEVQVFNQQAEPRRLFGQRRDRRPVDGPHAILEGFQFAEKGGQR
eukprot:gene13351-biopygen11326